PVAAAARVLVGTGDAIVFAATLALIPRWFSPRRVPLMTQLTTIVGQLGQILSAVPFVALLRHSGWSTAFTSVAAASALMGVLTARHPLHRSWLILGVVAADIAIWTLILALPGPAPLWLLVVLVVIL